jgi:predicted nucleic acid-binding protein
MSRRDGVFIDTGAWIALALTEDPLHVRAAEAWGELLRDGTRLLTSVPVVIETFTFLDRNANRDVALLWKDALAKVPFLHVVDCSTRDLARAWEYFTRRDLHKLSAVDATSFVVMAREGLRRAFAFDHHFAKVGFDMVG